jgi:hypothetical protein
MAADQRRQAQQRDNAKQTGERSAGNPHAAFDVAGTGNVAWSRCCDTRRRKGETTGNTNIDLNRRASPRPYLGAPGGEIPPGDSTTTSHSVTIGPTSMPAAPRFATEVVRPAQHVALGPGCVHKQTKTAALRLPSKVIQEPLPFGALHPKRRQVPVRNRRSQSACRTCTSVAAPERGRPRLSPPPVDLTSPAPQQEAYETC